MHYNILLQNKHNIMPDSDQQLLETYVQRLQNNTMYKINWITYKIVCIATYILKVYVHDSGMAVKLMTSDRPTGAVSLLRCSLCLAKWTLCPPGLHCCLLPFAPLPSQSPSALPSSLSRAPHQWVPSPPAPPLGVGG